MLPRSAREGSLGRSCPASCASSSAGSSVRKRMRPGNDTEGVVLAIVESNTMGGRMRIVVVTTSWPRDEGDASGHFVRAEARELERAGHAVVVVAPESGG